MSCDLTTEMFNYISVTLCKKDTAELIEHLFNNDCVIDSKYPFHVTLIYDPRKEQLTKPLVTLDKTLKFKANVIGFDIFGPDEDTPVFNLSSRELYSKHKELKDLGHEHSYEDLALHMSIGYDLDQYEMQKYNLALASYAGRELTFTNLTYS